MSRARMVVKHWTAHTEFVLEPVDGGYEIFKDGVNYGFYFEGLVKLMINNGYWIVKEN